MVLHDRPQLTVNITSILTSHMAPKMNVLELYSGVGGMHAALQASGVPHVVKASVEINPTANAVNAHNFPDHLVLNRNIESLTAEFVNGLGVDTILMSPPCQPFTRNGLQNDVEDNRCSSLQHLLRILPELKVERVLLENVKGFENSRMRFLLMEALKNGRFACQEFILSPTQFGTPNSRTRYYCLAKRGGFNFETGPIMECLPPGYAHCYLWIPKIALYLEKDIDFQCYAIPDSVLKKRTDVLDVCSRDSSRSCCFTKSYGRYLEGSGSVYTDKLQKEVKEVLNELENVADRERNLERVKELNLRFFTPREIANLMCFPETFTFPADVTDRQKYKLLGNSINVRVVSELIKMLNE